MNSLLKYRHLLLLASLLLSGWGYPLFAQNRQPDSLRNKQIAFNKFKQDEEKKKRESELRSKQEALAKTNKSTGGAVVVTYDSKGNKIETLAGTNKNGERVTTTTITMPAILNRKFNADTINTDSISIKVFKAKHRLHVYYKGKLLTAYKCVFGPKPLLQKQCEGDRCTPEGSFVIQSCKDHEKWDKFMLFDYPNEECQRRFEENKSKGLLPANARIGGLVGIHGIWQNGDNVIDLKHNWTDGCISLKNNDVEELGKIVKPGVTKITILK